MENDVRSKLKLEQNDELVLEFNENGSFFVLDDMDDLEEGMRIKVSILTQLHSNSSFLPFSSSSLVSDLKRFDSPNVNNECWWNTKPNEKTKWEERIYRDKIYSIFTSRS